MRSYFKCHQSFISVNPGPGGPVTIPSYTEDPTETSTPVFVQFGLGEKQWHLWMLNKVWQIQSEWACNPSLVQSPAHVLDITLILPYDQHPLN